MALTEEDISRIIEAEKEVFPTKTDFSDFRDKISDDISELQVSVDTYAKKADTYFQEMVALSAKINRLERNLEKIAKKVGVDLD